MSEPTTGQLILLGISIALLAIGGIVSFVRLWRDREALRIAAKGCMYMGLTAALAVVLWHSWSRRICPLNENFSALVLLALLLGSFVMYVQRARPLVGLDWFIMPIVILLLVAAGIFGKVEYREYHRLVSDTWLWLHRVTTYAGAIAFAVAAAGGAMYVLASRRLHRKAPIPAFGSLERLERMVMRAVEVGFALLTIGLISGFVRFFERSEKVPMPKLVLGMLAWAAYLIVLHVPVSPRLRGRRAAALSIVGFVLMVGTIVVVQLMPGGQR